MRDYKISIHSQEGHSSLMILLVILLISSLFMAASVHIRQSMGDTHRAVKDMESRRVKEEILGQVLIELESDPTPDSHGLGDPVWDYISSCQTRDLSVELKDISSRLNINFIGTKLFEETALKDLIINGSHPDVIRSRRSQEGFCSNFTLWEEIFGHENLKRFFTLYGWANINVTYEESLEELYRLRIGDGGAVAFRSRIQSGLSEKKLWSAEELPLILGIEGPNLYPVINSLPVINVNFAEPFLLENLLSYPYSEESLTDPLLKAMDIQNRRETREISPGELRSIINPKKAQMRIMEYLGTQTWFWELSIIREEREFRSVIAGYGEGWFIVE